MEACSGLGLPQLGLLTAAGWPMAGGCSRCSQEFQSKPCTRFGFKCWTTIAPLTVKILRLQSGLKFPSQAVWSSARLPGPCTPITLWVVVHLGLLGRCCCWPTGTCARAPAGGRGEPSLPGPPSQLGLQRHRAVLCRRPKLSKSRLSSTPPPSPPPPSSSSSL